jgi:hypothetical protein
MSWSRRHHQRRQAHVFRTTNASRWSNAGGEHRRCDDPRCGFHLLMDFAESVGASTVIRGIRGVTDFEYEYQLTGMNRQLNNRVDTVFLMADVALQPIASRLVKEIALYGGEIGKFVTPTIRDEVVARVAKMKG